ncbi:MAG: nucleotide-binding protein [Gulosibacter sp.]|uniref:AAA family ATPase n=1 Tax=Gulosibacter sp. TaxID=2817531 RepID=UPI003F9111D7
MARILLALDFDIEARLLEGILVSGHDVVDRVAGADALIESVTRLRPDTVIAQGGPETLNARSLHACDSAGSRILVLMGDEVERRNTLALGVVDRLDAGVEWPELEALVGVSASAHTTAPDGTGAEFEGTSGTTAVTGPMDIAVAGDHGPVNPTPPLSRRDRRNQEKNQKRNKRQSANLPNRDQSVDNDVPRQPRPQRCRFGSQNPDPRDTVPAAGQHPAPAIASPDAMPHQQGKVITVWGPYGSPGRTSIALSLAAAYANRGRSVVLIDADPYGGAVAQLLGISDEAPGLAAACRLAGADALNSTEFERVSSQVKTLSATIRVLSGIVNPERWPELSRARVRGVIDQARQEAEIVIVDVGFSLERDEEILSDVAAPRRNASTHTALEFSDVVLALADATPLGIQRFLRAQSQLMESVGPRCHVATVVNRMRGSVSGVDAAAQIRQVLRRFGGIEEVAMLPNDPKAADRAIAGAISILDAAPRSQFSRQLGALAERLVIESAKLPVGVS